MSNVGGKNVGTKNVGTKNVSSKKKTSVKVKAKSGEGMESAVAAGAEFLDSLPAVWKLLKQLQLETQSDLSGLSHVVVPVKRHKSGQWEVLASGSGLPVEELTQALGGFAYQEGRGCWEHVSDGKHYIMVALLGDDQGIPQKRVSLQFGLNCAQFLSHFVKSNTSLGFADAADVDMFSVLQGFFNGLYELSGYKSVEEGDDEKKDPTEYALERIVCVSESKVDGESVISLSKSQVVTRHLGDSPANYVLPEDFAAAAEYFAAEFGIDELCVFDKQKLCELKMDSLLSVSRGSLHEPKVIVAKVLGTHSADVQPVLLVGKGVTFDSGGISLKPPAGMGEMKYDMLGGATVFGALCHLASQKRPPHDTIALIGCVENMPGQYATRPGDVVTSYSGKTIEILNTDAEGRLVMADLLSYGEEQYRPQCILDMATLTGACLVALGSVGAAVMGHDATFLSYVKASADQLGVPLCELPLWSDLAKAMDSSVADVKNISSPNVKAGTITAGIFLSKFVQPSTSWAHFDIAGVGWDAQLMGYPSKGASGYGVDLLSHVVWNVRDVSKA
ncbi:MAG: leucyl aminopeptidase family protein [Proteobacteria bacterium]|nr:leucyl aminopeptidase family protein [Pseudomonadota bacterium]